MSDPQWLNVRQVASLLGVHSNSIKRVPASELPYWRFGSRGDRKYAPSDVTGYLERRMVR